jgi:hypothetical protein
VNQGRHKAGVRGHHVGQKSDYMVSPLHPRPSNLRKFWLQELLNPFSPPAQPCRARAVAIVSSGPFPAHLPSCYRRRHHLAKPWWHGGGRGPFSSAGQALVMHAHQRPCNGGAYLGVLEHGVRAEMTGSDRLGSVGYDVGPNELGWASTCTACFASRC